MTGERLAAVVRPTKTAGSWPLLVERNFAQLRERAVKPLKSLVRVNLCAQQAVRKAASKPI